MKLVLHVRKFFCRVPSCARRIFAERLPRVVAPWVRTTERPTMLLRGPLRHHPAALRQREYLKTIARDLRIDFRTARKYALSDECPTRKPHERSRKRLLEPYEPYLRARWK